MAGRAQHSNRDIHVMIERLQADSKRVVQVVEVGIILQPIAAVSGATTQRFGPGHSVKNHVSGLKADPEGKLKSRRTATAFLVPVKPASGQNSSSNACSLS